MNRENSIEDATTDGHGSDGAKTDSARTDGQAAHTRATDPAHTHGGAADRSVSDPRPAGDDAAAPTRVLICEDEPIIAMDLQMLVEDMGLTVIGPCSTMAEARGLVAQVQPDVAILDVNLSDGEVFPLADELQSAGTRLIFHSGHCQASDISARFPGAELSEKPYRTSVLKRQILHLGGSSSG